MAAEITTSPGEETPEGAPSPGLVRRIGAELRDHLRVDGDVFGSLGAGSAELWGRGWEWVTEGDWRTALQRLGAVAVGGYLLVWEAAHVPRPVLGYGIPAAAVAWCVAAWMASPSPTDEDQDQDEHQVQPEDAGTPVSLDKGSPADDETEAPTADLPAVARLIVTTAGTRGRVHLRDVLAAGQLEGLFEGWTVGVLRTALEDSWGVPCEDNMNYRVGGRQKCTVGVRVDALPEGLRAAGEGPADTPVATSPGTPAQASAEGAAGAGPEGAPDPSPLPNPAPSQQEG
ncbi:hypothetical protein [Streptomyces sp. NPDC048516]|uniref:hypothetical protein n=1 Tax=Streptomyces sp. NPDC048516 TaxID=3365565 RepID=UPI00371C3E62